MQFVKAIKTVNFRLDVISSTDSEGNVKVTVRPLSETGKKLMRIKQWSRATEMVLAVAAIATFVTQLEEKAGILANF
jgi:hypothetical protein